MLIYVDLIANFQATHAICIKYMMLPVDLLAAMAQSSKVVTFAFSSTSVLHTLKIPCESRPMV